MQRRITRAIYIISVALLVWTFASWADVVTHNTDAAPEYHAGNLFVLAERANQTDA